MSIRVDVVEDGKGNVIATVNRTNPPEFDNRELLFAKAAAALTANATYLAVASPSVVQNTAQTKALTRQLDTLIRLALERYESVADT